jgi:hypothetical protein
LELVVTFGAVTPERDLFSLISEHLSQGDTPAARPNNSDRLQHNGEKIPEAGREIKFGANSSNGIAGAP